MGISMNRATFGPGSPYVHSLVLDKPVTSTTTPSAHLPKVPGVSASLADSENYVPNVPPPKPDNVLLMLVSVVCVTLYISYYIWKRRKRGACRVRKLEDYSYSRLSQNEIDVDNIQFTNPVHEDLEDVSALGQPQIDENQDIHLLDDPNPATLHVEMDTAIGKHTTNSTTTINELSDEDLLQ